MSAARPEDRNAQRTRDRRSGLFAGETEARPGLMTSEFLLTVLAAATVVIAGYVSATFDNDWAWVLLGVIVAAYILSRGIAKAGSKEGPFIARLGARDE
jgi:hypothetical protein